MKFSETKEWIIWIVSAYGFGKDHVLFEQATISWHLPTGTKENIVWHSVWISSKFPIIFTESFREFSPCIRWIKIQCLKWANTVLPWRHYWNGAEIRAVLIFSLEEISGLLYPWVNRLRSPLDKTLRWPKIHYQHYRHTGFKENTHCPLRLPDSRLGVRNFYFQVRLLHI